ncbi:MAG: hypothetical protein A3J28_14450 [Acidobacteria bacterium RIFCSPLOWO2_12_FULL_60_22]|nr:MAG: hypothetical protein A3J28_14450 [Acidobacteria bacterium RIFCSPLOWO2_12_FULL_60_22]
MRKKFFVLPILFALCALALPAISQNQQEQMRFQGLDRNRDGIITRNEWRGNDQSFANEDWNGDGILSGDEVRPGARRPDDLRSSERSAARFRNLDRNNDGVIARNEWDDDRQAFNGLDANRDGVLSRDEFFARASNDNSIMITCSSDNGQRVNCNADTRGGVRLVRQISGSPCNQGSTWGYDSQGIWVDRGCRAEFEVAGNVNRGYGGSGQSRLIIDRNNNISWQSQGTTNARVYTRKDNGPEQLFAEGRSGTQAAPWIEQGHLYAFTLRDVNGTELARDQIDLRSSSGGYRRGYPGNRGSSAQPQTIGAGTTISVRTNEAIDARNSDGVVFGGVVNQDVTDSNGNVAIPKGSNVELIVRNLSNNELALDLDSVTVNGQRYGITAGDTGVSGGRRDSIGVNKRTGTYVGGGALLGAIIGGIACGGKGAAIGAGAGAAAGAGTQVLTRGKNVKVPAESLLTFRLEQPLEMGVADYGTTRNGRHYHDQNW